MGVFVAIDTDGVVIYWNPAAVAQLAPGPFAMGELTGLVFGATYQREPSEGDDTSYEPVSFNSVAPDPSFIAGAALPWESLRFVAARPAAPTSATTPIPIWLGSPKTTVRWRRPSPEWSWSTGIERSMTSQRPSRPSWMPGCERPPRWKPHVAIPAPRLRHRLRIRA